MTPVEKKDAIRRLLSGRYWALIAWVFANTAVFLAISQYLWNNGVASFLPVPTINLFQMAVLALMTRLVVGKPVSDEELSFDGERKISTRLVILGGLVLPLVELLP